MIRNLASPHWEISCDAGGYKPCGVAFDPPNGTDVTSKLTVVTAAEAAGWKLSGRSDLCPRHAAEVKP